MYTPAKFKGFSAKEMRMKVGVQLRKLFALEIQQGCTRGNNGNFRDDKIKLALSPNYVRVDSAIYG